MIFDSVSVETTPDLPPQQPDSSSVLSNRNFLLLWLGQIFSQIADKVYLVLIIAIISSQFQQEGERISGWVSAVMVAFTIPAVLFGSIAGVYVDRWSKKWVLVGSNLFRGGLVLSIPLLLWATANWQPPGTSPSGFVAILVVTFLVSTFTQFFTPAEQSAITLIVEKPKLLAANSICTTTIMAAMILGFAIGEPLLAFADRLIQEAGKEIVVGVSYLLAGLVLMLMKTGETRNKDQEEPHVWVDIKDGLQYLRQNRAVQSALLQLVSTFSVIAAMTVLAVRLAEVMPEIKSEQFGFLLADASLGIAIGAAIVGQFGQKLSRHLLALIGSIGMAIFLAGLSVVCDRFWLGLAMIGGIGIFAGISVIPMQTLIQEQTPEEMRGKVFGLQNNAINIALSLPLALAGIAESYVGLEVVILSLGAIALLTGILTWYLASDT
ncbi:sugar phosphate permease [Synechococcus sp. PCC 7502]|uniref:MFS transporter n=1 Tax=Synechococcus sp. PCC 7502 TaxID=1173263 RepID=UPI00029FCCFB|nr:MFS transporter [Synechococcus sp. PCC 7502]AFY74358.1 sugar phosphate permease [Synechococcus sp. PCC 7502]